MKNGATAHPSYSETPHMMPKGNSRHLIHNLYLPWKCAEKMPLLRRPHTFLVVVAFCHYIAGQVWPIIRKNFESVLHFYFATRTQELNGF